MEPTEDQPSRKSIIDEWFDNKFLAIYQNPQRVEHARRLLHRYQPDEPTLNKIIQFVLADNRRRKIARDRKEFYAPSPNCYTFFNESRWMDKIKETAIVEEKEETEKLKCPKCSHLEYPHMDNHEHLCSWHFSEKRYAKGPTGLDALRKAYKTRIPQHPNESVTHYLKHALKTGAERMHSARINKHLNDEESRLEREAIKQEGTLEENTRIRTELGKSLAGLEDKNEWR